MELEMALRAISAYAPCIAATPTRSVPRTTLPSWHNAGSRGENNIRRGNRRTPCTPDDITGTLFPAKNLVECVDELPIALRLVFFRYTPYLVL